MIDNPEQVERLVSKLRESLPLVAMLTPEVAAIVREQSPAVERSQGFAITRVDYAADEGGIVCKVELGPNNEDRLYLRRLPTYDSNSRSRSVVRSPLTKNGGSNNCNVACDRGPIRDATRAREVRHAVAA
jgi:hypothetical protein